MSGVTPTSNRPNLTWHHLESGSSFSSETTQISNETNKTIMVSIRLIPRVEIIARIPCKDSKNNEVERVERATFPTGTEYVYIDEIITGGNEARTTRIVASVLKPTAYRAAQNQSRSSSAGVSFC